MSKTPSPRSTPVPANIPRTSSPLAPPRNDLLPDRTTAAQAPQSISFVPSWRRPTLPSDDAGERRPSVQFVPHVKINGAAPPPAASRSSSANPPSTRFKAAAFDPSRRLSSPPPPAPFRASVSFDTFSNREASNFSLTLNRKHRAYEYTKRSRTFLCGTDTNDYSDTALEWLIDELVDDGDEVVCLRVVEKDSKEALRWAGGMGEKGYRREAERFVKAIEQKNSDDRAISLVLEFAVGKVHDMIQQMIRIYEPALLVVGTRGRSLTGYQGLLSSGSVSKYCLQYSPVPVVVVRPSSKREAKKRKRLRDPSRSGYRDILDKSEDAPRGRGGHLLDVHNRMSLTGADLGALGEWDSAHDPDREARLVAEAIGYAPHVAARASSRDRRDLSLSRVTSQQSDVSDSRSLGSDRALKSPESQNLDSPLPSDDEDDDDNDGDATNSDDEYDDDDNIGRLQQDTLRPEDEALALAYERAQRIEEEEQEEAQARAHRRRSDPERGAAAGGSRSRSRARDDQSEGAGAAALGLLAQLDRGLR